MHYPPHVKVTVTSQDLLSIPDTAKILHRHRVTIYRWIKTGKIAPVTIASAIFIPKSEVKRLQQSDSQEITAYGTNLD